MNETTLLNYQKAAFTHPLNITVVIAAAIAAFFMSDWGYASHVVLSLLFGLQLIYLGIVPHLPRFQRYVMHREFRKKKGAAARQERFRNLSENSRHRFLVVRNLAEQLHEHFRHRLYHSGDKLKEVRDRLDKLVQQYLRLLEFTERYQQYADKRNEDTIRAEIEKEEEALEHTDNEALAESRKRRLHILEKRLNKLKAATENAEICESHLETIEDAMRYIYEHTLTASDPGGVKAQFNYILSELDETSRLVDKLDEKLMAVEGESGRRE